MSDELNTPGAGQVQAAEAELQLPRPPGVFRRWLASHPVAVDRIIVGAYLFGCVLMVVAQFVIMQFQEELSAADPQAGEIAVLRAATLQWPWVLVSAASVIITAVLLRYRRRKPLLGVVLTSALAIFDVDLLSFPNSIAMLFLLFAVPVYESVRRGWFAYAVAVIMGTLVTQFAGPTGSGLIGTNGFLVFAASGEPGAPGSQGFDLAARITVALITALWFLVVLMLGINIGNRQRYVAALIDRVHQLAREREQRAQLATAAERARIAREMHDVVAHSLSVVVTLSEAASVAADSQPEAAKQAMERASDTGRSALVEMRRLLGVLAEDEPAETARAPQPGLRELSELVRSFADVGLRISFSESGSAAGDAAHRLAIFRIVQEGLTNALRHAGPGTHVELELMHSHEESKITLTDSGGIGLRSADVRGSESLAAIPGSGRGLRGIEERVRLFGGSLVYGPQGEGWRIEAHLPVQSADVSSERSAYE